MCTESLERMGRTEDLAIVINTCEQRNDLQTRTSTTNNIQWPTVVIMYHNTQTQVANTYTLPHTQCTCTTSAFECVCMCICMRVCACVCVCVCVCARELHGYTGKHLNHCTLRTRPLNGEGGGCS